MNSQSNTQQSESSSHLKRRQLPKLYACMTKVSLENLRNKAMFNFDVLDAKAIRRLQQPFHECIVLELKEAGYTESANYLQDLVYDNMQIVKEDELGIVVDLRKRRDYLLFIADKLQQAEKEHDKGNTKHEAICLLSCATFFTNREKGILWLAEKFYLAAIAVGSQYLIDAGRQKCCCKYYYAKFLLDKFPLADDEEPFKILIEVRDNSIGKDWCLAEDPSEGKTETVFCQTAIQLHRVMIKQARELRVKDTAKAERLARLAERRAKDAEDTDKEAEAILEIGICQLIMNNLNNAQKTFERALTIHMKSQNIQGICETNMHLAAVVQRLGGHDLAAKLLTEMGVLAMEHGLRRHLGRALHLLGELHLRRERPELGTQHLSEAFACFMGYIFAPNTNIDVIESGVKMGIKPVSDGDKTEIYEEEAEQSRLMTAISAGQELMSSYFNQLYEAKTCTVAQTKIIEWKLNKYPWWVKRRCHDFIPCPCEIHHRTPLDVLRVQLDMKLSSNDMETSSLLMAPISDSILDFTALHSTYVEKKDTE